MGIVLDRFRFVCIRRNKVLPGPELEFMDSLTVYRYHKYSTREEYAAAWRNLDDVEAACSVGRRPLTSVTVVARGDWLASVAACYIGTPLFCCPGSARFVLSTVAIEICASNPKGDWKGLKHTRLTVGPDLVAMKPLGREDCAESLI